MDRSEVLIKFCSNPSQLKDFEEEVRSYNKDYSRLINFNDCQYFAAWGAEQERLNERIRTTKKNTTPCN